MTDYETPADRLKKARIASGFKTAKAFCQAYCIPTSTYSLHETNKRCLKPQLAQKYAKLLNINVAWLLTGMGSCCLPKGQAPKILSTEAVKQQLEQNQTKPFNEMAENFLLGEHFSIDLILFSKLIVEITKMLTSQDKNWQFDQIYQHTMMIYQDIISSTCKEEEQFNMITFAIKHLKRQIIIAEETTN